jgi:hypothetical protein
MTIARRLTAISRFAAVAIAVGSACSACSSASPNHNHASSSSAGTSPAAMKQMSGTFNAQQAGGPAKPWVFKPCGDGCAEVTFPDHKTVQANLDNGQWRLDDLNNSKAISCPDGTQHPGDAHYSWNPTTLTGSVWSTDVTGACGATPGTDTAAVPFSLSRVG